MAYPISVLVSVLSGYIFVKFGRRKTILVGFIVGISGAFAVPFVKAQIYPNVFVPICCIMVGTALT